MVEDENISLLDDGKSIGEREMVQQDLTGKVAVKSNTERKKFDIFSVQGFTTKFESENYIKLQSRADTMKNEIRKDGSKKNDAETVRRWKEAVIMNKTKAIPHAKHESKDHAKIVTALQSFVFEDEDLPKGINHEMKEEDYIIYDTPKYTLKVKNKVLETKKNKWEKLLDKADKKGRGKKSKDNTAKVREELLKFVASKMRLKRNVFATEGEFRAYAKAIRAEMFKNDRRLDEFQRKLEVD